MKGYVDGRFDVNEDTTMAVCYVGLLPVAALKCGCSPRGFPCLNFLDFHYAFVHSCLSHSTLALSLSLSFSLSFFTSLSLLLVHLNAGAKRRQLYLAARNAGERVGLLLELAPPG